MAEAKVVKIADLVSPAERDMLFGALKVQRQVFVRAMNSEPDLEVRRLRQAAVDRLDELTRKV
ncbi:MAG: hypothetical protein [Microvirus sp.]|nr:MAG: hypothetical protein [Microvirus sp.]